MNIFSFDMMDLFTYFKFKLIYNEKISYDFFCCHGIAGIM